MADATGTSLKDKVKNAVNRIDWVTVTAVVVGIAIVGGVTYFAARSGIKPLKKAAAIVKG